LLSGALAAELADPGILIGQRAFERLDAVAERADLERAQTAILMRPASGVADSRADLGQPGVIGIELEPSHASG
jgi:hypothetical protein